MGHLFHSKFSQRAHGAAIIIRKSVQFEPVTTISDSNGRFVIVTGKLYNTSVIFASVYAPNWDNDKFLINFFPSLPNVSDHYIIIGGDFNLVQDVCLDRSSTKEITLSKSARVVLDCSSRLGLSDPWRFKNHQDKAFSYFSHVHHTFSRIDFFLLDNKLLQDVICCTYHPLVISDHVPVSVNINLSLGNYMFRPWRFPSIKLSDDSFTDFIKSQIDLYFELNQTPEIGKVYCGKPLKLSFGAK